MLSSKAFRGGFTPTIAVAVIVTVCLTSQVRADVYAAHLNAPDGWNFDTMGEMTIAYRLNEPATQVVIEIFRQSAPTVVLKSLYGTADRGLNLIQWDGTVTGGGSAPVADDYSFRIIAEDSVGHSSWENITPKDGLYEIGSAQYGAPQGIAVNRDQNSPLFGRVYVLNSDSSLVSVNPGATVVGAGITMLNNDLSFYRGTAARAAAPANAALETDILSLNSPWRLQINHDNADELVVGDMSDGFENVWVFNGEGTSAHRILDRTTSGPGAKSMQTHGNMHDVMISGVGAGRKLWVIDQDYDLNDDYILTGPDVSAFYIGTTAENYLGQPWEVINGGEIVPGAVGRNHTARGFYLGPISSHLYLVNQRFNQGPAEMAVSRFVMDGYGEVISTVWSLSNSDITADPVVTGALGIDWGQSFAIAVNEADGIGAVGRTGGGEVIIFDPADGSILAAFDSGADQIRDIDFDAAGNLYTTNETDQHVRVWSPPNGANQFTTTFSSTINIGPDASPDCNTNGIPDEIDIADGSSDDCNTNAVPDECDILSEYSQDLDGNGIPDECDVQPPVIYAAPAEGESVVRITRIDPGASALIIMIDGNTNGIVTPEGASDLLVAVPPLSIGEEITARVTVFGAPSTLSDPETVTTSGFGSTLICDDFEYLDQAAFDAVWIPEVDNSQLIFTNDENSTIGGQGSAYAPESDAYRSKVTGLTGILPTSTHPLVWSVNIYDETAGTGIKQYADLNADLDLDFFLAEIGLADDSLTSGPETHYQLRIVGNGGPNWVQLDQFDGPVRSVGWHRFVVVFKGHRIGETQGHYIDVYVDGLLAAKNIHLQDDTVLQVPRIGSGFASDSRAFFDDYCAQVGPVGDLALPKDCNTNGIVDFTDIALGTSVDSNSNGVPDECDPDCNNNSIPDDLDIANCTCMDCNTNGTPDECEIASGAASDCNTNGVPDACDVRHGRCADGNTNGIPDSCDMLTGAGQDCDVSGRLDSCEINPGGQIQKILASDAAAFQEFGHSIAMNGEWAIVGVPRSGTGGAAYVYRRNRDGTWTQHQRIVATDAVDFDQFGQAVAIDGDYLVVGVHGDDDAGSASGSAYVFRLINGSWYEYAKLLPSNGEAAAQFGWSVAISGDDILVGAFAHDDIARDSGSVYCFRNNNGVWTESQIINANDQLAYDLFGWSIDMEGDKALIGAMRADGAETDMGTVYVFANNAGTWQQTQKLVSPDPDASDYFGYCVSMSGTLAVIGAIGDDEAGSEAGAAYAFCGTTGTWLSEGKLLGEDTASFDSLGSVVAISGDYVICGSKGDDDDGASSGSAYVFHRQAGVWQQKDKLTANDAASSDQFGNSVAINGYDMLINSRAESEGGNYAGAVYAFRIPVADCNATGTPDICETIATWDFNGDGGVGVEDLHGLLECMAGPSVTPNLGWEMCSETCLTVFDADADGDVDLVDFAGFQAAYVD